MQAGQYKCRATGEVQWGRSARGSEQVAAQCVVEGGAHDGETFWWVGAFASPESSRITVEGLRALGARLGDGDITDLTGLGSKAANVTAKVEVYEGKERMRYSIGAGFGFKDQLDRGGLEALRQRMRGELVAGAQRAASGAPRAAASGPAGSDDIPF